VTFLAKRRGGRTVDDSEFSHFGSEFDISTYPVARQVISSARRRRGCLSYDEVFKVQLRHRLRADL